MKRHDIGLLVQMGVLLAMATMYFTFPKRVEQVIKYEYVPPKIPISYLYKTVRLRMHDGNGTGIALSSKFAITCAHVAASAGPSGTLWVICQDETGTRELAATVFYMDAARDLALVRLSGADDEFKHYAQISDDTMTWGDRVVAVGSPSGRYPVPVDGKFVKKAEQDGLDTFEAEGVAPGNSGGPIFDTMTDQVVGITCRMFPPAKVGYGSSVFPLFPTHVFSGVPNNWILDFLRESGAKLH